MINHQQYLALVQAHLDERFDPLEDPKVVAFLDAHPEHLTTFAELRANLRALAQQPPVPMAAASPADHRWHYLGAAAAATLLVVLGWTLRSITATSATTEPTTHRHPSRIHPPRILMSSLEELEPTLRPAAFYTVRDPLVQTTTFTLEAYQDRSELR